MAHFIFDNKVDETIIDEKFNWGENIELISKYHLTDDNFIKSSVIKFGDINIEKNGLHEKFWMCVYNGENLFARMHKHVYYDASKNLLLSRNGDALDFGRLDDSMATPEYLEESLAKDLPPVEELKWLFEYILSNNKHFYLLFSQEFLDFEVDYHINHLKANILATKNLVSFASKEAHFFLIKKFDKGVSKIRDDIIYNSIFKVSK